jgi:phosphate:Na+ symporter
LTTTRLGLLPAALRALSVLALGLTLCGCDRVTSHDPAKLVVVSGKNQTGAIGADCAKPVVVEVLSKRVPGLLGGKGKQYAIAGVKVRFEPVGTGGLEVTGEDEVETDSGGMAATTVRFGERFGDQYLKVSVPNSELKPSATIRFIAGIEASGNKQEVLSGNTLDAPITLRVTDKTGQPVAGVPVFFTLVDKPGKKGKLSSKPGKTDEDGIAEAQLHTDAKATGHYKVLAEVADPERCYFSRGIEFEAMALNRGGLLVAVLGGLGIFILGMKFMSDGLQQVAGPRLKSLLHFFTANRFTAVAAGTVITGLIQSSSACTVMVVGFVNAGLLSLNQAIGIIFGANIGTTVTGQMVSFKLNGLALPAIAIGVAMALTAKKTTTKHMAQAIFGFGLLFLGMTMMSTQLKAIAKFPSFISFFSMFDCQPAVAGGLMPLGPVLGAIGIGTAMTMVVQSSSATIGLTIVLATSGLLNFYTAVPIILGDNIGTTITALLASIGTNKTARQSAIAHTIFNVFGALYMVLGFYIIRIDGVPLFMAIVEQITAGAVFSGENVGRHVASAHTLFNVFNVVLFIPLVPLIAWLCQKAVPIVEDEDAIQPLEPHLLDTPPLALQQAITAMEEMTKAAWKLASDSYGTVRTLKLSKHEDLAREEERIDRTQSEISEYLVKLTQRELTEEQAQVVPLLIHCVNDAERIGDRAENLLELAVELANVKEKLSKSAQAELDHLVALIDEQAKYVVIALSEGGEEAVANVLKLEGQVNELSVACHDNHVKRLGKGKCTVPSGVAFVEVVANLERIGDHLTNIAERAGEIRPHRFTVGPSE